MTMTPSLGSMRWLVVLAQRTQVQDQFDAGLTETVVPIASVHAQIEPLGLQAWIGAEQIDTPVTHRIYIRWQPWLNVTMFNILQRQIVLPDGSTLQETYRIRRAGEVDGRHRFIQIDAELEQGTPG